ncbi:MAG TPA: RNHCP domain-containing protein [candidate division WWE3 bacterium]|uniref:RNHCP domain-containing protein n=1 Tax=candidate division WWE3 bacterium TaxID=2053526 RepID=A0A7C1HCY5_UNCKA|nr:RNHCP domain-containing protein [candidate division WWE3 bacterium]
MHFICANCGKKVPLKALGTKNRNHCPFCLFSTHVDLKKGDREAPCRGKMAPIGKFYKSDGEEMLVHKCQKCGFIRWNRVAGDDSLGEMEKLPVIPDPR